MPNQMRRFLFIACVIGSAMQIGLLWWTTVPLGVSTEWEWPRVVFDPGTMFHLLPLLLCSLGYVGFVVWTAKRIERASPRGIQLSCLLLAMFASVWMFSLLHRGDLYGITRSPFVLFYERTSGYFTQARDEIDSPLTFLKTYQERIADSDRPENYLHQGTHPPGLSLCYYGLIQACETSPILISIADATQPQTVQDVFTNIRENSQASGIPFPKHQQVAIWWAVLLTGFLGMLTLWPAFLLLKRTASAEAAWWAVSLWPLVPALAIFLPKSDVLYPFFAVLLQWLWLESMDRKSVWLGLMTGVMMFLALNLTLAFAPIGVMLGAQFLWRFYQERQYAAVSGFLFAIALSIGLCWICFETNIVGIWIQNLKNHATFYDHHTRTYLPWLVVNPIELGVAVGAPLAFLGLSGLYISIIEWKREHLDMLIAAGVWELLWLSGKNMGEAARLWIFLMPIVLWVASITVERAFTSHQKGRRWCLALLCLQLLLCILTVIRIDGFHLDQI